MLDEKDRIAPPGAFGTLFIGGDGLAKGYFDRPDLTARSFRKSRWRAGRRSASTAPATGPAAALGRLRARRPQRPPSQAARLSHRARGDRERAAQTPDVRDCAVVLRHEIGLEPALVAYVVRPAAMRSALRADLALRLPDYMVPTRWGRARCPAVDGWWQRARRTPPCRGPPKGRGRPNHPSCTPGHRSRPRSPPCGPRCSAAATSAWKTRCSRSAPISLHVFRIAARLQRQGIAIDARDLIKNPTVAVLARKAHDKSRGPRTESGRTAPALADFRRGARRRSVSCMMAGRPDDQQTPRPEGKVSRHADAAAAVVARSARGGRTA